METELESKLRWLINLRWAGCIGIFVFTNITKEYTSLKIQIVPFYAILGFIALYNVYFYLTLKRWKEDLTKNAVIQVFLDCFTLSAAVYLSGGFNSPFLYLFLLHIVIIAVLLPKAWTLGFSAIITILLFAIIIMDNFNLVRNASISKGSINEAGNFIINAEYGLVFAITLLLAGYFAAYLNERFYRHRAFFNKLDKSIILNDVIEAVRQEIASLAGHEDILHMPLNKETMTLVCSYGGISMSIPLHEKNVFTDVLLSCETHTLKNMYIISEYENRLFEEFLPRATEITVFPIRGALMARCYDFFECPTNADECSARSSNDRRCWTVSGTYCKGRIAGNAREKLKQCVYCDMFAPVGVFVVGNTRRRHFGAGIDIDAYDYMLESVSYVISNAKLYAKINEIPEADPLTGLVSKRTFYRLLADEMRRAQRYGKHFGLFIIDIDHFKKYNDVNGHAQGDILLKSAADIISKNVRSVDVVGRYGSEEFIVLLPETEKEEAESIAERIRSDIENHRFPRAEHSHGGKVTVSIGVVMSCKEGGFSPEEIICSAEDALYNARRMGGNRVLVSDKGKR